MTTQDYNRLDGLCGSQNKSSLLNNADNQISNRVISNSERDAIRLALGVVRAKAELDCEDRIAKALERLEEDFASADEIVLARVSTP